ncbi:uncharacterized protein LOC114185239 isoform X1 [Vigna unguiculata]|uniref:uncharacterized protein LOC114185239 isoform X1 n=1 Tax=Vigna unguiculata TaxID=3917 RepID=UPI001016CBAE|nr:uncharacterized protein LOC114185239 isoform X1 [Vigna unguiculata]XP_027928655.1 uncharacterized protein LOC114185239 isoform X1 [Vigna unguiculata]
MSFESEKQNLLDQATDQGLPKKIKISYTREFLLSVSGLDICRELPSGFDQSLLSELEDVSQDRQRSSGGLSMHSFRRNDYGSSPPTRGDSFPRGIHGKWETRSSGRSDKDSDSQSEWDSDSAKRFGNQSRRSWQGPEHDGLLGSGSFPRPSGYTPGLSAPKLKANDNYQLNRSSEPYHPPRPYKAPHSRRETNDSYNDETFGSLEYTSEDRAEEERKRRASFELMRKEQHKAFQDKHKLNPDKNNEDFDITSLVEDDEKRLVNRNNESVEPHVTVAALSNDEKSSSLSQTLSAARPLVPPGFASTKLERNFATKTSVSTHSTEAGQPAPGDAGVLDIPDIKIGTGDQLRKRSALSEVLEASQLNAEVKGKEDVGVLNPDNSNSILYKLFGNASTVDGDKSTSIIEQPDNKADVTWSPHAFQSSKFAHWFVEEEKNPVDDMTQRPNDLLSLIVGGEKGGLQTSNVETTGHIASNFSLLNPEPISEHMASNAAHTTIDNSLQLSKSDKPEVSPAVLTCEDLEQSILSQVSENGSSHQQPIQDKDLDGKTEQSTSIDNHASLHLLSLLQKGTSHNDMELSSILDSSTKKVPNSDGFTTSNVLDNPGEENAEVSNSSKTLTLETLFGSAFMKELQSVGAPLSVQRGSVGSAGPNVSESLLFPFPTSDNVHLPTGEHTLNRRGSGVLPPEQTHQPKTNRFDEQWLGYSDSQGDVNSSLLQSEFPKASGFKGPRDIHLPEEDNLITVSDPLQNFLSAGNIVKADMSQDTTVDITRKLAALNPAFRDDRLVMRNHEGPAYPHGGPYDMREPGISYQNLNVQRSQQIHPQLNHGGPMFNQLDSHPPHISSYMRLPNPEGMIHHDSPPNHQFPGNMLHPPFHQPSSGLPGFDSPVHHSMLQQMHMQGNHPPPHLLRGFPRGGPVPSHPNNPMTGFMQEPNPMQGQGFPFNGHQHPSFGGPGMQLQAPDVGGGRNHPEALQRLFEMELRSNPKSIHASGHSQGMYGQELDLGFGYR